MQSRGEAVTSVHIAALISEAFDWPIKVDSHLRRCASLSEIYSIQNAVAAAARAIARWIAQNVAKPPIVGPDAKASSELWGWRRPVAPASRSKR